MSYILDALKRADSERERGAIPGLHAQPAPLGRPALELRHPARTFMLLLTGLVVALLCGALWNWLRSNPPVTQPQIVSISPPATSAAPAAASAVPAISAFVAVATPPISPPVLRRASIPATQDKAPPLATSIETNPGRRTNVQRVVKAPIQANAPDKPVITAAPQTGNQAQPVLAAPTATRDNRVASPNELPEDIRLALPKLVISGSTYSNNPAYRMLIISGQIFHEGEKPAPDLELEQIKPKAAIFNFKGQRYSIGY